MRPTFNVIGPPLPACHRCKNTAHEDLCVHLANFPPWRGDTEDRATDAIVAPQHLYEALADGVTDASNRALRLDQPPPLLDNQEVAIYTTGRRAAQRFVAEYYAQCFDYSEAIQSALDAMTRPLSKPTTFDANDID